MNRRELEYHRKSLGEIREIMSAMKSLAFMETRKLSRFIQSQKSVVDNIELAAADFLHHYGNTLPQADTSTTTVYVLIGTERGFCGDINQSLIAQFEQQLEQKPRVPNLKILAVGHRLHTLLESDPRVIEKINGANVAEEVTGVMEQVVVALSELHAQLKTLAIVGIYNNDAGEIVVNTLLPPFRSIDRQSGSYTNAPTLNLSPEDCLLELSDHYLFAALSEMFYTALLSENHRRVAHLEGSVKHLDNELIVLERKSNMLRQEEITEEIEVILLSTESISVKPKVN